MIITHRREKLINAIIYFAKHTQYFGKIKLMKLLFFLDFTHFKQTGKPVTGLEYLAWEKGPVSKDLFLELNDMKPDLKDAIKLVPQGNLIRIVGKREFDSTHFTKRELRLLENLCFIFRDAKAEEMSEISHLKNEPWHKTISEKGENAKIDYLLSVDTSGESLTFDEAKERMEEISETHRLLGTAR